jgi:YVTN family beta-propeller protein
MKKATFLCIFASLLLCLFCGCAASSIFKPIGDNIASPNGIAVDAANNRLYLVNSNSNVLYDWQEGSIQVYDITDPLHPVLMSTVPTYSFSGEAIIDSARKLLYVTNRYSESTTDNQDTLLVMNIDEASPNYLQVAEQVIDLNPYGLYCCYPADRIWIATESEKLDYRNLADYSGGYINMKTHLSNGGTMSDADASYIAVIGNQAFLPRINGGMFIVNLDEAGDVSKNAVNYFIEDIRTPGGIATDGTLIYQVDEEDVDGNWTPLLLILDLSSLVPLTGNELTQIKDKDTDGLLVTQIEVGKRPQRVFLTSKYAFVSCWENDVISVIDLAARVKITDIAVGQEPFNMALYAPGGIEKYLYVGNIESNTLSIIDLDTLTVAATYP